MGIVDKLKQIAKKMNEAGIPLPLFKINGAPTLTGTMVVMSFTTALLGQIGKLTKFLGPVDLTQANYLLGICLAAYLGRRIQGDGKNITMDEDKK